MSVRLVATDLDGTALLPGGTDASPRVIAAIAAARAAGIEVAVVTARNWRSAATLAAMLGAEPRPTDAPRRRRPHGCRQRNEGAGAGFAGIGDTPGLAEQALLATAKGWSPLPSWMTEADIVIGTPEELIRYPLAKLLVRTAMTPAEAYAATERLRPLVQEVVGDRAVITVSGGSFIELSAPGVDKASGVGDLCRLLGIGRADVVAVGDHVNDLPLLQWAGRGVAMGDSHPDVLAAVAERTATNADDGLALVLEGLLEPPGRLG